jgi:hypothetical protein
VLVQASMAPTIAIAEVYSQDLQRSFTNMNHYVNQAGDRVLGGLPRGLAPLAGVAEAVASPVQRVVQAASGSVANVRPTGSQVLNLHFRLAFIICTCTICMS